jgi:hypothetical protein
LGLAVVRRRRRGRRRRRKRRVRMQKFCGMHAILNFIKQGIKPSKSVDAQNAEVNVMK